MGVFWHDLLPKERPMASKMEPKVIKTSILGRSGKHLFLLVYTAYRKGWPLKKINVWEYMFVRIFRYSLGRDLEGYF